MMLRWVYSIVIAMASMLSLTSNAVAGSCGVVLMHGKWSPVPTKYIGTLADSLRRIGCVVETPEMPWSGTRLYSAPLEAAVGEVDAAMGRLKKAGATSLFIGGHSMGAAMALLYGANHSSLVGIIALAPGHDPGLTGSAKAWGESIKTARAMVAAGNGGQSALFEDTNGGAHRTVTVTAANYLSYFDAERSLNLVIPTNASHLSAPLLWVTGDADPVSARGTAYAFDKAPANPQNHYGVVSADHLGTPNAAIEMVTEWVKAVSAAK